MENRIYRIEVERYLKGEGPSSIFYPHALWRAFGFTPDELQANIDQGNVIPRLDSLDPKGTYLFFLVEWNPKKDAGLDLQDGPYYQGDLHPYVFDISNPDQIKSLFPHGVSGKFKIQKSYQKFLEQIQNPEATEEILTPYP